MDELNIKVLEDAIDKFYRSGDESVHDWLTEAQKSPQAWTFVWELMKPGKSSEIQFFGATTLHSKIVKYWKEVPEENQLELKQKLFESLILFGNGPKIVLNRICVALSAFICHCLTKWPNAIEEIINLFKSKGLSANLSGDVHIWILFEILGSIPEEGNAIYLSAQRAALRNEIRNNNLLVLRITEEYFVSKFGKDLTADDKSTLFRAAKSISVWIKIIGLSLQDCRNLAQILVNLVNTCYWANAQKDDGCMLSDEIELAEQCLETLTSMMIQPSNDRNSMTALEFLNLYLTQLSNITKAEWKENNSNEDIALEIYSLFIASIEVHSEFLANAVLLKNSLYKDIFDRLIHEILQCSDKPGIYPVEESCSTITFGFWYMLQDNLCCNSALSRPQVQVLLEPVYTQLTQILIRKAKQPDELSIEKWSLDDLESFRCYRQDITDTLTYSHHILDMKIFDILIGILEESILIVQTNHHNWTQLEAAIFGFFSIAERAGRRRNKHVERLMTVLTELPYEKLNEKVLGIALETIGVHYDWFNGNPSYLPAATELLVKCINTPMAPQATMGLKDLSRECSFFMQNFAEPLLDRLETSLINGVTLNNNDILRVMYTMGRVICLLPADKILKHLNKILTPAILELQQLIQTKKLSESENLTIFRLNMISTLFSSFNFVIANPTEHSPVNPLTLNATEIAQKIVQIVMVLKHILPLLGEIANICINNIVPSENKGVIDMICDIIKYSIVNLENGLRPILSGICDLIIYMIKLNCKPSLIQIARITIIAYKDAEYKEIIRKLFTEVQSCNLKLCDETNDFSNISVELESFFNFNTRIVHRLPELYADPNVKCEKLLIYALKAMVIPETETMKTSIMFTSNLILQSRNHEVLTKCILEHGHDIVTTTILCISTYTLSAFVETFADIFLSINKKYPAELVEWMKILNIAEFPNNIVTPTDKAEFCKLIIREKVNKRLIQCHIRNFSTKCRK